MDRSQKELAALLPNIAVRIRMQLGSLHLAAAQAIPAEERERDPALDARAAVLDQSFYRLLRLTNSLNAAEYLAEDTDFPLRDADLVELVSGICETSADLAELLEIDLRFVCAMERRVCGVQAAAVEQLLYQLLSNALKYTAPGGSVTVELQKRGDCLLLSVTDTGRGIPPEQQLHLFDGPTSDPDTDPDSGLGLGLLLCRTIAQRHGGSIAVTSAPGRGSRFTVSLPDRQVGGALSDVTPLYDSGFNRPLLELADALPSKAYSIRYLD